MENETQLSGIMYPVVLAERFPHGILCPGCGRVLLPGAPYHNVPVGMDDDTFTLHAYCVYCS